MSGYRILIVGCGQLGSRHLQAAATCPEVGAIEVVDPRPESIEAGQKRLDEMEGKNPSISYKWFKSIDEASTGGDLCVVATQAEHRCRLIKIVAEQLGYQKFLVEKIVAQSTAEYEDILAFSKDRQLNIWINFKGRAHPSHAHVKAALDPSEPMVLTAVGGNHGLANNGIHIADLFLFLDGTEHIEEAGSRFDEVLHPSKRGSNVYDLSGSMWGISRKGSRIYFSFSADHDSSVLFQVLSKTYRAVVDDVLQWMMESRPEDGWRWHPVPFQANMRVSHMSKTFIREILTRGSCALPSLEEGYGAHLFILDQMQPHFNRLLRREEDICPVT